MHMCIHVHTCVLVRCRCIGILVRCRCIGVLVRCSGVCVLVRKVS